MKKFQYWFPLLLLIAAPSLFAQNNKTVSQKPEKQIWIKLKTGPVLTGNLVQIDSESVDFKVKNILQSVPFDDVAMISFVLPPVKPTSGRPVPTPTPDPTPTPVPTPTPTSTYAGIWPMSQSLRPIILYKEKAKYTEPARRNRIEGTVILNVVFTAGGSIENIRVVRGLPQGLTENAIEAAKRIRFTPAIKDGQRVSVRGNLEFTFSLYEYTSPIPLLPKTGTTFDHYPRKTVLEWLPVKGALSYGVEIEWGDQDQKIWTPSHIHNTDLTRYTFNFTRAQPGRWRVWAMLPNNEESPKSDWQYFRYTR